MWHHDDGNGTYSYIYFKKLIISLDTVSLLWLLISPILTPMCTKPSLMVFEERLMRFMNIDYLVEDNDILLMKSWNLWKASYNFCWRWKFWVAVFFAVSFPPSQFYLLLSATSLNCATWAAVKMIPELESWFLLYALYFINIILFCCSVIIHYLFISWIGKTVCFLTASYAAACNGSMKWVLMGVFISSGLDSDDVLVVWCLREAVWRSLHTHY